MESTHDVPELKRVIDAALPRLQELMIVTEACNDDLKLSPLAGMAIAMAAGLVLVKNSLANQPELVDLALGWTNIILRPAGYELHPATDESAPPTTP